LLTQFATRDNFNIHLQNQNERIGGAEEQLIGLEKVFRGLKKLQK
jgi:hypothetical protein